MVSAFGVIYSAALHPKLNFMCVFLSQKMSFNIV